MDDLLLNSDPVLGRSFPLRRPDDEVPGLLLSNLPADSSSGPPDPPDSGAPLTSAQILLLDRARRTDVSQRGIRELMKHLPESDEELHGLIEFLIDRRDQEPFSALWCANMASGRPIDSRLLVESHFLLPYFYASVHHLPQFRGDVAGNALAMIRDKEISLWARAITPFFTILWCRQQGDVEIPHEVFAQLRKLAREPLEKWKKDREALNLFCGLLTEVEDSSLTGILEHGDFPLTERNREAGIKLMKKLQQTPLLDYLPEGTAARVISGGTVMREAGKRGRNDLCHCGSAKKYKKCCEADDRQRDLESPSAPGLVFRATPDESSLTKEKIILMPARQAFDLDLQKLSPGLQSTLLMRLWMDQECDRIVEHCRALPAEINPDLKTTLQGIFGTSVLMSRPQFARDLAEALPWLEGFSNLSDSLLLEAEAGPILDLLESEARNSIEKENPKVVAWIALRLLQSGRYPALGVILARGAIASSDAKLGDTILKSVREVLDANHWNPFDPADDILDLVYRSEQEQRETEDVVAKVKSEADEELETKRGEIRKLQWELKRSQDSLKSHQREREREQDDGLTAHSVPEVSRPTSGKQLREVKELRDRCSRLQTELRQRHSERNEMRRSLQEAQESLSKKSPGATEASSADQDEEEDALLLNDGVLPNWPPRFAVWPAEVRAHRKIPDSVWRAAFQLTGRLAAGEPASVQGVKLLKGLKGICRQRVAGSWRLMFEVDETELRIIDLVPRRDLVPWARARAAR